MSEQSDAAREARKAEREARRNEYFANRPASTTTNNDSQKTDIGSYSTAWNSRNVPDPLGGRADLTHYPPKKK